MKHVLLSVLVGVLITIACNLAFGVVGVLLPVVYLLGVILYYVVTIVDNQEMLAKGEVKVKCDK